MGAADLIGSRTSGGLGKPWEAFGRPPGSQKSRVFLAAEGQGGAPGGSQGRESKKCRRPFLIGNGAVSGPPFGSPKWQNVHGISACVP